MAKNLSFDSQFPVTNKLSLPNHQRVYFATNRERVRGTYSTDADSSLNFGEVDVIVPSTIEEGQELVWGQGPAYHVIVQPKATGVNESPLEFIQHISSCLASTASKHLLIYIHGFNVTFEGAVTNAGLLAHHTGFKGLTMVFDWASYGSPLRCDCPLWGNDRQRMDDSYEIFTVLLQELLEGLKGVEKVHIMAHSMGTYMLYKILQGMDSTTAESVIPRIDSFIFAAPDVSEQQFNSIVHKTRDHRAPHMSITVYCSGGDSALFLSCIIHRFTRRVGHFLRFGSQHLLCPFTFEGVETVDVSGHGLDTPGHSYFTSSKHVLKDIGMRIGTRVPSFLTRIDSEDRRCCPKLQKLVGTELQNEVGRGSLRWRKSKQNLRVVANNTKEEGKEGFPAEAVQVIIV